MSKKPNNFWSINLEHWCMTGYSHWICLKDKDLLDRASFSNSYWQSDPYAVSYNQDLSLFSHFSYYSFHGISGDTVLFPSRRCESEDYSELYRTALNDDGE
eukprot:319023_1